MCGTAGDVPVGLGKTQNKTLQAYVNRVGQGGVVHLWVVALDLIHPALHVTGREGCYNNRYWKQLQTERHSCRCKT